MDEKIKIKIRLNDYMSFRHFIRHSYSSELDWMIMGQLVKEIENIWQIIKANFEVFIENN